MSDDIEVVRRIERMLVKFYTSSEADIWWSAPHEQFGGKSALDMVSEGRGEEVIRCLKRLDECAYL